jgi:tRNA (cytidine/uridine-2'-O-)-methyltransferase
MSEKACRRAGLDYWHEVDCQEHASWQEFLTQEVPERLWLFSAHAKRAVWDADLRPGDYLLFGAESQGLPKEIHQWAEEEYGPNCRLTLPVRPRVRSLNLATAVCAVVYEGLRQVREV